MRENVRIYRPNQRYEEGYVRACMMMFRNFIEYRELIWQLYRRDLLTNYKKSLLGTAWIVLTPLIGIISWVFLHHTGLFNPGENKIPYPAFLLIGTSVWGLFMGCFTSSSQTLTAARSLVMQVSFPREVFLFEKVLLQLTNFGISLVLNLLVILTFHVIPAWETFLFPLVVLPLILFGAAIGLIASMIVIVAEDLGKLIHTLVGMSFWITPIIFSDRLDKAWARALVEWNPLTYLVCSARDIILFGRLYDSNGYWISTALSVMLFVLSWRAFYISQTRIIERMI